MPQEYFDIVDENTGVPTGEKRLRSEAHSLGLWHRTVHAYLFRENKNGVEFLVHLRAKDKDLNPNKWDTRFGGHLKAGETYNEAIENELKDEIGLTLLAENTIEGYVYKSSGGKNNEFSKIYYYQYDGDIASLRFNDGEIQEVKWMSAQEIEKSLENDNENWCGSTKGFREISDFLKKYLLKI